MHVKKGDNVIVLTGKDKGKIGNILKAFPREDKVLIEGVNIKKVHSKGQKGGAKGQMIEKSFPVHVSNVKLKDSKKSEPKAKKVAKKKAPAKKDK